VELAADEASAGDRFVDTIRQLTPVGGRKPGVEVERSTVARIVLPRIPGLEVPFGHVVLLPPRREDVEARTSWYVASTGW
jgi:hypothetical protein